MRRFIGGVALLVCIFLLFASYEALRNLWADYQDSPDSLYITVGAIEIALAAMFGGLCVYLWRSHS
jgi:hypothetical protein